MRSLMVLVVCSAMFGLAVGAVLGYLEARPWAVVSPQAIVESIPQTDQTVQGDTAEVQLPEKTFNFGKMDRGATMDHAFKIRNLGGKPLRVEVANTTCKCTVGDMEKSEIPPGEESEVVLEWTAKTPAGRFRHGATLTTNDPKNSRIELVVEGEVVESSTLIPGELLFGDISTGDQGTAELYLVSKTQADVQIVDYEFSDPTLAEQIDLEISPAAKNELPIADATGGVKVTANYQANRAIGRFRGWLELKTNLEQSPKLSVLIAGSKVGDISIFGPGWVPKLGLLRMGNVHSDKGKVVQLNLAVRGELAPTTEIEVAQVDPPELEVSLGQSKTISDHLVHMPLLIELPAGTRPMVRTGEPASRDALISLKTNNPSAAEVNLRLHFTVEP